MNRANGDQFLIRSEYALVKIANTIRKLRGQRRTEFGLAIDEPAWDMLVELYCRDSVGASTTTALLEDAATVPASTAARWLKYLEHHGLAMSTADPTDPHIRYVEMTQAAKEALERYLTRVMEAAAEERSGEQPTAEFHPR